MEIERHDGTPTVLTPTGPLPLRQVICIGLNYRGHAAEQGIEPPERPLVFSKNLASLGLHGEPIVIPRAAEEPQQVDFEGELGVVIGRDCRDASEESALDAVLGYTVVNDVSARWWQKEGAGKQFWRGKSFDTFCPFGPRVVAAAEVPDPQSLAIETWLSGERMQAGNTAQMIFPVRTLIAELSRGLTLLAGTLLLTGTPAGVGMARAEPRYLRPGDQVRIEIEGVGTLENEVRAASE